MSITVYDYAEHIGEALAWTSPSKGWSPSKKDTSQRGTPVGGQLLYTHLKQAAMFGGDSNSRWYTPPLHNCGRVTALPKALHLRVRLMGLDAQVVCQAMLTARSGCADRAPPCRSDWMHMLRHEALGGLPHITWSEGLSTGSSGGSRRFRRCFRAAIESPWWP